MNIRHLITENGDDLSLGRIAFWVAFVIIIAFWVKTFFYGTPDAPDSLLYSFFSLLAYNTGKKFRSKLKTRKGEVELLNEKD